MSQRYFCAAKYTLSQNLKLTLTLNFFYNGILVRVMRTSLGFLGLGLGLGLGFGLVCTPLIKDIAGLFFWSYP